MASTWKISEVRVGQAFGRLAGYAVCDALGVRLGYVSGWVSDPSGEIQMLTVAVTEWEGSSEYLVPVGAVTLISDSNSMVQLRDVTKQSIGRLCYRLMDELPEARLLISLQRHFPAARPSVVERLHSASALRTLEGTAPSWKRLSEMAQGQTVDHSAAG